MHCEKCGSLLPLLDEGKLPALTTWRLRRHLAACPACAADHAAFAALDARLRAADPAAPFVAAPADRSPVRPAPSPVRRRLLLGAASAASLAALGGVGVTVFGPGKVAFAQVQEAMASVRTAEWTMTETWVIPGRKNIPGEGRTVTTVSHVRARMNPPAIVYEAAGQDRKTGERFTNTSLSTPDGHRSYRSQTGEILFTPRTGPNVSRGTIAERVRGEIRSKLTFTPPDATDATDAAKKPVWETRKVMLGNKPALRFTIRATGKRDETGSSQVTFTLWADPDTKRVLRTEQEERDAATGARTHFKVVEGIRCDIPIPNSAFALHAPAGTPVYHQNQMWKHQSSIKLTPEEKAQVNHLIDETYAGILASDWKRVAAGWDLGYATSLPGSPVPVGGLEKWLRGKVAEGHQYKMMRRQAVSGINDAPYVRVLGFGDAIVPPGKPHLVAVTLTPGILRRDGHQELGTETFYFRRDAKAGFRIVGWQYPERLRLLWRRQWLEMQKGR